MCALVAGGCGGGDGGNRPSARGIGEPTAASSTRDPAIKSGGGQPGAVAGVPTLLQQLPPAAGLADKRGACIGSQTTLGRNNVADVKAAILCLLNAERTSRGLAALRSNEKLVQAATDHAREMVARRYFAHDGLHGDSFIDRIRRHGYMKGAKAWLAGENLGWGQGDRANAGTLVDSWMASPPHRANILKGRYEEIGIAVIPGLPMPGLDPPGGTYTTEFGRRDG